MPQGASTADYAYTGLDGARSSWVRYDVRMAVMSLGDRIFSSIIILWGHRCVSGLLWTKSSLRGM